MIYVPKMPRLTECIGLYGQGGAGKGEAVLCMMRRMTNRHFHIIDTDAAWEFMLYEDDERNAKVIAADNFTIHTPDPHGWEEQKNVIELCEANAERGDWVVFDHLDPMWESVPGWYTATFLGLDETEYKARVRLALEEKRQDQIGEGKRGDRTAPLFDQLRDYQFINPEYKRAVYDAFKRLNAKGVHVVAIAHAKPIGDNDPPGMRKRYKPFRERPGGQKDLTEAVNTMIHLAFDGDETYTMSVAKDRGSRMRNEDKPMDLDWSEGDFCKEYLSPVAGWHMEKVD